MRQFRIQIRIYINHKIPYYVFNSSINKLLILFIFKKVIIFFGTNELLFYNTVKQKYDKLLNAKTKREEMYIKKKRTNENIAFDLFVDGVFIIIKVMNFNFISTQLDKIIKLNSNTKCKSISFLKKS